MKAIGIFYDSYIDLGLWPDVRPEIILPLHKVLSIQLAAIETSKETTTKRLIFRLTTPGNDYSVYSFVGYVD